MPSSNSQVQQPTPPSKVPRSNKGTSTHRSGRRRPLPILRSDINVPKDVLRAGGVEEGDLWLLKYRELCKDPTLCLELLQCYREGRVSNLGVVEEVCDPAGKPHALKVYCTKARPFVVVKLKVDGFQAVPGGTHGSKGLDSKSADLKLEHVDIREAGKDAGLQTELETLIIATRAPYTNPFSEKATVRFIDPHAFLYGVEGVFIAQLDDSSLQCLQDLISDWFRSSGQTDENKLARAKRRFERAMPLTGLPNADGDIPDQQKRLGPSSTARNQESITAADKGQSSSRMTDKQSPSTPMSRPDKTAPITRTTSKGHDEVTHVQSPSIDVAAEQSQDVRLQREHVSDSSSGGGGEIQEEQATRVTPDERPLDDELIADDGEEEGEQEGEQEEEVVSKAPVREPPDPRWQLLTDSTMRRCERKSKKIAERRDQKLNSAYVPPGPPNVGQSPMNGQQARLDAPARASGYMSERDIAPMNGRSDMNGRSVQMTGQTMQEGGGLSVQMGGQSNNFGASSRVSGPNRALGGSRSYSPQKSDPRYSPLPQQNNGQGNVDARNAQPRDYYLENREDRRPYDSPSQQRNGQGYQDNGYFGRGGDEYRRDDYDNRSFGDRDQYDQRTTTQGQGSRYPSPVNRDGNRRGYRGDYSSYYTPNKRPSDFPDYGADPKIARLRY